jgi:hypothetical protein
LVLNDYFFERVFLFLSGISTTTLLFFSLIGSPLGPISNKCCTKKSSMH